ncbi:MAG: 5-methyltetrahydrofolate--homocysteine methyltransferase, partial [Clostridiales bacterium]|nr:5-methyltetrahydrofolate--homocysteine methyltransferase [Clostridiales bacterium]
KGSRSELPGLVEKALAEGMAAASIVDDFLIPAISKVGSFFNDKIYFLPQLIQSAEAMKAGFDILEPLLVKDGQSAAEASATVVLATVKGDIHDIGKNIVGLMLKNYGFKVYDLGKDCPAEHIISEAERTGADIIGLSALMTTTMTEMPAVIKLAREKGLKAKIMVGGAVVDADYANQIGADGYSKDAYEAVVLAGKLSGKS